MNIKQRLKQSLILRSLNKRRDAHPFNANAAEHFSLPEDADDFQNNSHYYSCHDMQGNSLFFRHAKRGRNKTEVWFCFKEAGGRVYYNKKQLYIGEGAPTHVACKQTGHTWVFGYNGPLADMETGAEVSVELDGSFHAAGDIFSFNHHLDVRVMADAIAKEKWSRSFFGALGENDQVHYEQPGTVDGKLILDGRRIDILLPAMRDHSYGKRDWTYMNRHFWLMALLEDGSSFNANMVSYPALPNLQTGYFLTNGHTVCVRAAQIIGSVMPGAVPDAFEYDAQLMDGRTLRVSCKKETQIVCPFENGAYTIYEGIGTFDIDGIKGRGILEFGWNGDPSRYA